MNVKTQIVPLKRTESQIGRASLVLALTLGLATIGPLLQPAFGYKTKLSKEEKKRQKAIKKEMESPYKKWLDEEVPYIITPEEKAAFKKLSTDEEREQFIEQFWERRNPNPGSPENEFKEEYYRRIAYANEHFSSGIPGWKTDRGRIYIMYGPPDEIDSHPSGGTYVPENQTDMAIMNPMMGGAQEMTTYPFEDWRYRYIEGIGENITLEFVDPTMSGEYRLTMNPCEKDAMAMVPGDNTMCQGSVSIGPIFNPVGMSAAMAAGGGMGGMGGMSTASMMPESMEEFTQLDTFAKIFKPPAIKFNDMRSMVTHKISAQLLPFNVRADYVKITDESVLTPITVQVANRDLQFQNKDGVMHAVMDIYGQLSTLSGRVAQTFEDSMVLDVPQHDFASFVNQKSVYQKAVTLRPGRYKLTVVLKDDGNGHMGSLDIGEIVPDYPDDALCSSSLILADLIQRLPTNEVGTGPFVIGSTKVRPRVNNSFSHTQNLGMYMQVYNLTLDPKTHRPSALITYEVRKDGKTIFTHSEDAATIKNASEQVTIRKTLPLASLQPGNYTVAIKVTDNLAKKSIEPTASFQVN
jgi:GWxTD domain-containing protein